MKYFKTTNDLNTKDHNNKYYIAEENTYINKGKTYIIHFFCNQPSKKGLEVLAKTIYELYV